MATIIGTYRNDSNAQKVVHDLRMAGFGDDDLNLVSPVEGQSTARGGSQIGKKDKDISGQSGTMAMNVVLGGIIGVFLSVAFGFFTGIDPIVTGLAGAVLGAMAGAVATVFMRKDSDSSMSRQVGFTKVEVDTPDDRIEQVTEIMEKHDPVSLNERTNGRQPENQEDQGKRSPISTELLGTKPKRPNETNSGDIPAVRETVYYDPERLDEIDVDDNRFPEYEFYVSDFRRHFNQYYANRHSFQDYEPAYRYGYSLAADHRRDGFDWYDIEPGVRDNWQEKYGDAWDQYKDAIRYAWDRLRTTTSDSLRV